MRVLRGLTFCISSIAPKYDLSNGFAFDNRNELTEPTVVLNIILLVHPGSDFTHETLDGGQVTLVITVEVLYKDTLKINKL